MIRLFLSVSLALGLNYSVHAQETFESEQARFSVKTIAQGLEFPWSLAFLPSGEMLITEREGRLRIIDKNGQLLETPVKGLPADLLVLNQGGLLDIALAHDFETSRTVYLSYAEGDQAQNQTCLARGRLSDDLTELEVLEDIFRANYKKSGGYHFGGRILINDDGTLYLTLGDGGRTMQEAQNIANHLGSVVHLNPDGSPVTPGLDMDAAAPGIFTYGHRNPQGIVRHPITRSILIHEHGPRGGDELNILEQGANYGWPTITYGINYNGSVITDERRRTGLEQPVWYWVPSIAPSGMAFYTGDLFEHWKNDLFVSSLAGMSIQRLEMDGDRVIAMENLLNTLDYRFRDVRSGPDGALYVLVDDIDGAILRLSPAED